jgi:alkyl hydroperoxide reductase subunit AhpC
LRYPPPTDNKFLRYLIMYWYPLDFTFVCASELIGFSKMKEDLAKRKKISVQMKIKIRINMSEFLGKNKDI